MKYFICRHCGNIAEKAYDAGVKLVCCGEAMEELIPNSTEAATEKHYPVAERTGSTISVKVSDVAHPMAPEHWIQFIALETQKGYQRVSLKPGDAPGAVFPLAEGDKAIAAYEHCNLHGLWKTELDK